MPVIDRPVLCFDLDGHYRRLAGARQHWIVMRLSSSVLLSNWRIRRRDQTAIARNSHWLPLRFAIRPALWMSAMTIDRHDKFVGPTDCPSAISTAHWGASVDEDQYHGFCDGSGDCLDDDSGRHRTSGISGRPTYEAGSSRRGGRNIGSSPQGFGWGLHSWRSLPWTRENSTDSHLMLGTTTTSGWPRSCGSSANTARC
jgi:hypothetical protein